MPVFKTDRPWNIGTSYEGEGCLKITEYHEGSNEENRPYILIPHEAMDAVIKELIYHRNWIKENEEDQ